jgi:hypothetical protein
MSLFAFGYTTCNICFAFWLGIGWFGLSDIVYMRSVCGVSPSLFSSFFLLPFAGHDLGLFLWFLPLVSAFRRQTPTRTDLTLLFGFAFVYGPVFCFLL